MPRSISPTLPALAGLLALLSIAASEPKAPAPRTAQLKAVDLKEPNGEIRSYRHLAGSIEVYMRGTRLAPDARIKLKIGSRPGFVELDINRGGISNLKPAHRLGKDFLTYVLWAVSVDGRASNLGEITFQGENPVPVNLTTPYQTFWLMVTAEPNFAVVDPSSQVVLYSVKEGAAGETKALTIRSNLFYFTHYPTYESTPGDADDRVPNQLLQARKAVELASKSSIAGPGNGKRVTLKEEEYTEEALEQARTFLARAEAAYTADSKGQDVIQFARTAAQSAENARALAMGAVGGILVRQLEDDVKNLRDELAQLRKAPAPAVIADPVQPAKAVDPPVETPIAVPAAVPAAVPVASPPPLVKQPALWFAVAGWGVAIVLLFRRKTI